MSSWPTEPPTTFADTFAAVFNARERSIELEFPEPDRGGPPPGSVIPQRVEVREAISSPFHLTVHALAEGSWRYWAGDRCIHNDTPAHPDAFMGRCVRVIVRAEGQERIFDGVVTGVRQLGHWRMQDQHLGFFQLLEFTVQAGIALLAHRVGCNVFQEMCPMSILNEVIGQHHRNPSFNQCVAPVLGLPHRPIPRAYITQYKESDLAFVERLIATEGLTYTLPNREGGDFGHALQLRPCEGYSGQAAAVTLCGEDADFDVTGLPLRRWHSERKLTIPRTRLSSPDYRGFTRDADIDGRDYDTFERAAGIYGEYLPLPPQARPDPERDRSALDHAGVLPFEWTARVHQADHDFAAEAYRGETIAPLPLGGTVRVDGLKDPRHTRLHRAESSQRPYDDRHSHDYVITSQTLVAYAPLHADLHQRLATALDALDAQAGVDLFARKNPASAPRVRSSFTARPADLPVTAHPSRRHRPAPGAMTGKVVGQPGDDAIVATDELGRIGVKLDWQRQPDYTSGHPDGRYAYGDRLTWLRYVQPGAGDGFGFQYLPRVGDEVLVQFLHDDPDRPIAIGSLYSPHHRPPEFGGERGLPQNAALTGLRTREHRGAGSNELAMDDTPGEVGLRLASSTANTALTLGHVATPRTRGEAAPRGVGAELRTEGAAALRAAQGMLLTTFDAAHGAAHLDHKELTSLLTNCRSLLDQLARSVEASGMRAPRSDTHDAIDRDATTWADPAAPDASMIAVAAASAIVTATRESQLHHADANIDLSAGNDIQLHSGRHLDIASRHGMGLYTEADGLTAHAHQGDLTIRAATDNVLISAGKDITLDALRGTIHLRAEAIELTTKDGSRMRLSDAITLWTKGNVEVHATRTKIHGPKSSPLSTPDDPENEMRERDVVYHGPAHTEARTVDGLLKELTT